MIEVVTGDARDVAAIMPVMQAAFSDTYREAWSATQCIGALASPGCTLLLARKDEAVAGFTISRRVVDEEELLLIAVAPEWQRQQVASRLLAALSTYSSNNGVAKLFLEVRENNSAQHFYKKQGFEIIGTRPQYYKDLHGNHYAALTMAKAMV